MNDTRRLDGLRAQYRILWDDYQIISHKNAQLLHAGKKPTDEALINEQQAAAAVEKAREELLAAMARLGD